jgi:hypothetical protein
MERLFP